MSPETLTLIPAEKFVELIFSDGPSVLANYAVNGTVNVSAYFTKRGAKGTLTKNISFSHVQITGELVLSNICSEGAISFNDVTVSGQANLNGLICEELYVEKCSFEGLVMAEGLKVNRLIVSKSSFPQGILLNGIESDKITWQDNNGEVYVNQPGVGLIILMSKSGIIAQYSTKDE